MPLVEEPDRFYLLSGIKWFKIDQCCCLFSLKNGAIFIAVFYLIRGILGFTIIIYLWVKDSKDKGPQERNEETSFQFFYVTERPAAVINSFLLVVASVYYFTGIDKEKPKLLKLGSLITAACVYGLFLKCFLSYLTYPWHFHSMSGEKTGLQPLCVSFCEAVLGTYFILQIYAYFIYLKNHQVYTIPERLSRWENSSIRTIAT